MMRAKMRRQPIDQRRRGFTLLEVLLAAVIAAGLFYGLYSAMRVELRQASVGREMVETSTLSRSIINRLSTDLTESLTPPKAKGRGRSSSGASSSSGTTNTTGSTGTTTDAAASSSTTAESETEVVATAIPLQAGVIGYSDRITIFATRLPTETVPRTADGEEAADAPVPSDINRITYWLMPDRGLCRQVIPWVTGEDVYATADPVIQSEFEEDYVIAPEIVELGFEYYDMNATNDDSGWTDSWIGSDLGADGRTVKGPPAAIRVRFVVHVTDEAGNVTAKEYRHVIPILTASGPSIVEPTMPETTDGTTSTTTTGMQQP